MQKINKIIFLLINLLLLQFCYAQDNVPTTKCEDGRGLDGIVLIGDLKKDIQKKYGKSDIFVYTKRVKIPQTHPQNKKQAKIRTVIKSGRPKNKAYYQKLELFISFSNGVVNSISFKTNKYKTSKGLTIGDSRERMKKLYQFDSGSPIVRHPDIGLEIIFECDIITEIRIIKPY